MVILNWNGRSFLEKFLPFVLASNYENLQVIVADNASTDDSIKFLEQNFPSVLVITNPSNEGYARGYNLALEIIEADYYILLNSDVEVSRDWIEPIISLMESNVSIAACQPKILSWANKNIFEYAGASGGWIDSLGYPFCRGRIFDVCETDEGQYNDNQRIFWASGAALFVKSKAFHEVNGLDESFFAHQEELDLCWRMQLAGYQIFVCPASVVYHVGGGTLPKENPRKVYLNFRNNLIMLGKNYSFFEKIWKIPARILLDILSALRKLFSGDAKYFSAVFLAHMAFFAWIFSKADKRFKPISREGKPGGVYRGSIVWQFFVKKKKWFHQIVTLKK